MLTRTVHAVWEGTDAISRSGDTLRPGSLHLKSGLAQIEFFSGATLLLEGDSPGTRNCVVHGGDLPSRQSPRACATAGPRLQAGGARDETGGLGHGVWPRSEPRQSTLGGPGLEGEVEAHPKGSAQLNLKKGQGLQSQHNSLTRLTSVQPSDFAGIEKLDTLNVAQQKTRYDAWWNWAQQMRRDPRLIAFFPFQHLNQWDRFAGNIALPEDPLKNGGIVGAAWAQGRWPMKDALEFKRPGDRVRLRIPGAYQALTFACWVRVDGLDRKYNALLLTDGYDPGAPHWQIYEDGRLMFSISYPDPADPQNLKKKRNQIYYSPVVFNRSETGRWHHIAVTYDSQSGEAAQYLDGVQLNREVSPYYQPGRQIVYGDCELGNWGLPTEKHKFPIRNLNGRMDEFAIFQEALSPAEIKGIYDAGNPE